jgi:hypothetical protein
LPVPPMGDSHLSTSNTNAMAAVPVCERDHWRKALVATEYQRRLTFPLDFCEAKEGPL